MKSGSNVSPQASIWPKRPFTQPCAHQDGLASNRPRQHHVPADIADQVVQFLEDKPFAGSGFIECLQQRNDLSLLGDVACVTELILVGPLEDLEGNCATHEDPGACELRAAPARAVSQFLGGILQQVLADAITQVRQDPELCPEEDSTGQCVTDADCEAGELCEDGTCAPAGTSSVIRATDPEASATQAQSTSLRSVSSVSIQNTGTQRTPNSWLSRRASETALIALYTV